MNKSKAAAVLKLVNERYTDLIADTDPKYRPQITRGWYRAGDWCITWPENAPYEWTIAFVDTHWNKVPGVFMEPVTAYVLGIYDE